MQDQNQKKPYGGVIRTLALIAALAVIVGTIFAVFLPAGSRDASLLPTAYPDGAAEKPWKDLKKGASGKDVQKAQQALAHLGFYEGKQDGNFSKAFEEAVLAFQKDWGLEENGVIDRETFELLTADLPQDASPPAPTPTDGAPGPQREPTDAPTDAPAFVVKGESYSDKEHVAAYLKRYGELPPNYITKAEAQRLGWVATWGNLWEVAPGKSIGGDRFGNYEGQLPAARGRKYYECDIDYDGAKNGGGRNGKRIVYSSDGLIFYTGDHYNTFEEIK